MVASCVLLRFVVKRWESPVSKYFLYLPQDRPSNDCYKDWDIILGRGCTFGLIMKGAEQEAKSAGRPWAQ